MSTNVRGGSIDQAEKALLGALLIEPEYVDDVAEHIRADDFSSEQHKEIFKAFVALSEKGYSCDMLSMCRYMETQESKFVANGSYLANLMCEVPVHQTIPQFTELVRNGSLQRKVMDCTKSLMSNAITGNEDGITSSIKALVDLWDSGSVKEFCSLTSAANKYVTMLKQRVLYSVQLKTVLFKNKERNCNSKHSILYACHAVRPLFSSMQQQSCLLLPVSLGLS